MRRMALAAALLAACSPTTFPLPAPPLEPVVPEEPPPEVYEALELCPEGEFLHTFEVFPDGEAHIGLRGPGKAVNIDAKTVHITDDAFILAFAGSSEPLGFADGEALILLDRLGDGSARLQWESWKPVCGGLG